jgi:ADP-heptose:LPS heptosyltransferase
MGSNKFLFDLFYDKAVIQNKTKFKSQIEEMSTLIKSARLNIPKNLPYTNLELLNRPNQKWLAICPDVQREESQYPVNFYGEIIKKVLNENKFTKVSFFIADRGSPYKKLRDYGAEYVKTNNLREFITTLSKYGSVLTAEGGSAHIAGALGLSVFIISGTKNQKYWKPHAKNIKTFTNTDSVARIKPESIISCINTLTYDHSAI